MSACTITVAQSLRSFEEGAALDRELTKEDCQYILSCLEYTLLAFESTEYPSNELKQEQLDRLALVKEKLRGIRDRAF